MNFILKNMLLITLLFVLLPARGMALEEERQIYNESSSEENYPGSMNEKWKHKKENHIKRKRDKRSEMEEARQERKSNRQDARKERRSDRQEARQERKSN